MASGLVTGSEAGELSFRSALGFHISTATNPITKTRRRGGRVAGERESERETERERLGEAREGVQITSTLPTRP